MNPNLFEITYAADPFSPLVHDVIEAPDLRTALSDAEALVRWMTRGCGALIGVCGPLPDPTR